MRAEEKFIIDRFEGDFAVLENEAGVMTNVPLSLIDLCAKEGEYVYFNGEMYEKKIHETEINDNRKRILNKFEKLKKK